MIRVNRKPNSVRVMDALISANGQIDAATYGEQGTTDRTPK